MIDPRDMRSRVTIYSPTKTQDATTGQMVESDSSTVTKWAKVEMHDGTEVVKANKVYALTNYKIVMRYTDVSKTDHLLFDGKTLHIKSITNDTMKNWLTILASEVI